MSYRFVCMVLTGFVVLGYGSFVQALPSADFLGVEGPPSLVGPLKKKMDEKIRTKRQFKWVPVGGMDVAMVRLTLGCMEDSSICMQKIGKIRQADWLFHVRLTPAGDKVKAVFRKIEAATGTTKKLVEQTFPKNESTNASQQLIVKMFGGAEPKVSPSKRKIALVTKKVRSLPPTKRSISNQVSQKPLSPVKKKTIVPPKKKTLEFAKKTVEKKANPDLSRLQNVPEKQNVMRDTRSSRPSSSVPMWKEPTFWGWVTLGVAVASAGGLIGFGLHSRDKQVEVQSLIDQSEQGSSVSFKNEVLPLENQGRTSATMANVFLGLTTAAVAGTVVLFLMPKKADAVVLDSSSVRFVSVEIH